MKRIFLLLLLTACICQAHAYDGWKAYWISTQPCQSQTNTWLAYRKTFSLDAVPATLTARIAADSKYWLWINGKMAVFEGGLKRGPAPGATYYDSVDIAPYLKEGDNVIAVLVWFFGKNGFSHVSSGTAGLLFDAQGDGIEIVSDRTWQCNVYDAYQQTSGQQPNYRLSESNIKFDARKALSGWTSPEYEGKLGECRIISAAGEQPFGTLIERPIPLWKDYGLKDYESITRNGETIECLLPYNCQATPYLKVKASAGITIKMQTDNYSVAKQATVRAEYITTEGEQEYESIGWMNGHKIIYTVPEGVEVLELKFRETGYDTEFSGSFNCDDEFLNELWKRSQRTLYVTMRDSYMDCPDRERAQWFGDEAIELSEAFYALSPSSHALATKGIYELVDWQRKDGSLYGPCPTGNYFCELPLQMLAFIGWYGFHEQYFLSGDSSFVDHSYGPVHKYLHEVWQIDEEGFPIMRTGEWEWGDWGSNVDMQILTTCWYYLALKSERAFALMTGRLEDALTDSLMMDKIEKGFDGRYWVNGAYRSPGYKKRTDDRAQAMAVLSGLAKEDKYEALLEVFKTEFSASPYMEKFVLEALFRMDETDYAIERMKARYDSMINKYPNLTTLFEYWGTAGTINHAWSGGPLTLLSQFVCGIQATSPGFRTFAVKPQMGPLNSASATIETKYGFISVSLQKKGSKINLQLEVPDGTSAEVALSPGKTKVFEAGKHSLVIKP